MGAGPGNPGLFTLKGRDVLSKADVVIYDALVGKSVLAMIPPSAKCINAGKRADKHLIPQHETNRIIYEEAARGQRVVRLKGGDPFVFGRGGEEAEYLKAKGIEYEVVPGVTSPVAVTAYNGIPVTHRDFTSSVHFITAHKRAGKELDIDFESLVKMGGTCVFLMGLGSLETICRGLLEAGIDKDMPAAVLSQGTTARQSRVVATVGSLVDEVKKKPLAAPALIVVGQVCSLADQLKWCENLPLFGKRILVTRPRTRSTKMANMLRALGAEVIDVPSIRIEPIDVGDKFKEILENIRDYSWIVFTSPAGIEVFFEKLADYNLDVRALYKSRFAVIGQGTGRELRKHGIIADLVPEVYDNEALGNALKERLTEQDRVLIPRASIGNPVLTEILQTTGAEITDLNVYDTISEENQWLDLDRMIAEADMDYVTFTSASTVHNFVKLASETRDFSGIQAICIGRQTKEAAESYGMQAVAAQKATIESMCQLILEAAAV